jgi:hypothetical protein
MKRTVLGLGALTWILLLLQGNVSAQENCVIADEEEYAVLAAVLFPNRPDVPDSERTEEARQAYLATATVHLDGFHGNSYTIQDQTEARSAPSRRERGADRAMINDFVRKQTHACHIDRDRLLRLVPEGRRVSFLTSAEVTKTFSLGTGKDSGQEFRARHSMSEGVTYLSRPGFDASRTEAVLEVSHRADYEMGIGYRVYLKKSSRTGLWVITAATVTRRS